MASKEIRICYFPGRESSFVRNRVLINGMRKAGLTVHDCSYHKKNILRYFVGFFRFLRFKSKSDLIFIGFFGQFLVPIVRLFTRKIIIFDAFLSSYQTLAFDRKSVPPKGFIARIIRTVEVLSCKQAAIAYLDTNQHINYYLNEYTLPQNKFKRLLLGADDSLNTPREDNKADEFIVHFHGEFQALHGTKYILDAAKLLPDIKFRMVGEGSELALRKQQTMELGLKNLIFIPSVKFDQIPDLIASASICLGIFGETQKTRLVIPLKIYEALAMQKPIISADTPAVKELLTHKENIYLCEPANSTSLAEAIKTLKDQPDLRQAIAENGYKIFKEQCSPVVIGQQVKDHAEMLLGKIRND
jgi:glycosyltransferase involved in cell wall biosynthesis